MSPRFGAFFLMLILLASRLPALPAWEWTAPPADSLMLGKPFSLSYSMLNSGSFTELELPMLPEGWMLLEADSTRQLEREGKALLARNLKIIPFSLDPCTLLVEGPVPGGPLQMILQVPARLEQGAGLADLAAPLAMRRGLIGLLGKLWPWLAGLLLLGGLYWFFRRAGRRKEIVTQAVKVPALEPWERFMQAWAQLEEEALDTRGRMDEHYAAVSLALRGLVEDATGLPCRERTTLELEQMDRPGRLTLDAWQELLRLLEANDSVKYARQWPDTASAKLAAEACLDWARRNKAQLASLEQGGAAQ